MKKILKRIGLTLLCLYIVIEAVVITANMNSASYEENMYPNEIHWYNSSLTYLIFFYDNNDGYVGG